MKHIVLLVLLFISTSSYAQFFKKHRDFSSHVVLTTGFGAELGKWPTSHEKPFGYSIGTAFEFGDKVSEGFDWSAYAKGHFYLCRYAQLTAQIGVKDLIDVQAGIGLKAILPTENFDIVLEPVLRTQRSVFNVGARFKL